LGCRCPICSNYGDAAFAVLQHGGWRDWGHIQRECPIPPQLNIPGEGCRGQLPLTSKPNKIHGYWCCSCDGNSACVYQNTAFCLPMNSTPCAYAEKRGKARPLYRLPRVQATPYCSYPKSGRPPPFMQQPARTLLFVVNRGGGRVRLCNEAVARVRRRRAVLDYLYAPLRHRDHVSLPSAPTNQALPSPTYRLDSMFPAQPRDAELGFRGYRGCGE